MKPTSFAQFLDVGRERELLAIVEVGAVVREEEADVVEVLTLLDLLLVDRLESGGFAVVGVEHLLKCASRDVLLLNLSRADFLKKLLRKGLGQLLVAADDLVLLNADGSAARYKRGCEVVLRPLRLGDVAPAKDLRLAREPRERESGT